MTRTRLDIELSLPNWKDEDTASLSKELPAGYGLENRGRGWGLVIRSQHACAEPVDVAIEQFLGPLEQLIPLLRPVEPILRVAVFNKSVTCTLLFAELERLRAIGAKLEISVYPTAD